MRHTIIIERKRHRSYHYLAEWISDEGMRYTGWFTTLKEIREYFDHWGDVEYIYI